MSLSLKGIDGEMSVGEMSVDEVSVEDRSQCQKLHQQFLQNYISTWHFVRLGKSEDDTTL